MRWWTSDLHFGHHNIIDFCGRPFYKKVLQSNMCLGEVEAEIPDVDAMNEALIDNWNSVVDKDDEVWVVGDVAMGNLRYTVPLAKRLKGRKLLIPGNHDAVHPMHKRWRKYVELYEDAGFEIGPSQEWAHIAGRDVLVCHFPYRHGDVSRHDGKYSGLLPDDEGSWLIHGHTHSTERVRERMIHVGVDAWDLRPVSEDTLTELIENADEEGTAQPHV